ncbi:MAG: anthranilate synthase component I [Firmicutes bacterium]|nr:anthranilate synthase component I [Bacillota bacterium]
MSPAERSGALSFSAEKQTYTYRTKGGLQIRRATHPIAIDGALDTVLHGLDEHRGAMFSSSYEYPGRYSRWEFGFIDPPLSITACQRHFTITALNDRGRVLLPVLKNLCDSLPEVASVSLEDSVIEGEIATSSRIFTEEERSRQPSVFSLIRAVQQLFFSEEDTHLGLYGAFGYDLVFQFEEMPLYQQRDADQQDLVLYVPDQIVVADHRLQQAYHCQYDFIGPMQSTEGMPRKGARIALSTTPRTTQRGSDHAPGQYAQRVHKAIEAFARGDLFEVVPGQTLSEPCTLKPSELFARLKKRNPSPYGFLIHLGNEHLIGASPEMYVRVEGDRVETCPISGTIARGKSPLEDAVQIRELLNSTKDESELTMCTDVDRNDKSRICVPSSVRVIGRRQIEMYSRVIHTVDHVEGRLREGFDALDAFLTHMWAVTVTGAPKRAAIAFLEREELSPRRWYGGAVGFLGFNGDMNTGLTLRTIRLEGAVAQVRVGATLLFDSDPVEEELETRKKASAMIDAILVPDAVQESASLPPIHLGERNVRVLLVDHHDSFVHTLANYVRQTGAEVTTLRAGFPAAVLDEYQPDLVMLSPGPGRPEDFGLRDTIDACLARHLPIFGVCLGLQGITEYFGGTLCVLSYPMHGKPSSVVAQSSRLEIFAGLPNAFLVGRYHSLFASDETLPDCLQVTARSDDGVIMAIEHKELPICAVQFHPESILTMDGDHGLQIIYNTLHALTQSTVPSAR